MYLSQNRESLFLFNMEIELDALGGFASFVSIPVTYSVPLLQKMQPGRTPLPAHPGELSLKAVAGVTAVERVATCSFTGGHLGGNHRLTACAGRDVR